MSPIILLLLGSAALIIALGTLARLAMMARQIDTETQARIARYDRLLNAERRIKE